MNEIYRIQFLGSGTMFSSADKNFHNNALILAPDKKSGIDPDSPIVSPKFLIDCGSDIRHSIAKAGMKMADIDHVYISHLHDDHAGGLECLGFASYFDPEIPDRPKLFISSYLRQQLWQKLSPSMKSIADMSCDLDTFFDVESIGKNHSFQWEKCTMVCIQQVHIMDEYTSQPSFGLKIVLPRPHYRTIYFTSDTKYFPDQMIEFYKEADVIFQDCEVLYVSGELVGQPEEKFVPIRSMVHAHYEDLKELDPEIKSKMWLMHCQDNWSDHIDPVSDGFLGVVERGQTIEL